MRPRRARGFTLLELLVVVVIIGIVIAGTILALGATGQDRGLQQERDRLTALIDYVRERGAMMTTEYGILCGVHGYRFVYYDDRSMQWQPETLDDTLRPRHLPDGLTLSLVIEGRPIVLDDAALQVAPAAGTLAGLGTGAAGTGNTAGAAGTAGGVGAVGAAGSVDPSNAAPGAFGSDAAGVQSNAPQILLLSDGDTNSFELTMLRPSVNRSVTIKSAADGTISAGDIVDAPQ